MALSVFQVFAETERSIGADAFGELAARRTAERYLSQAGIAFQRRSLLAERGGFGTSLEVDLPSRTASPDSGTLVIAAPLSSTMSPSGAEPDFAVRTALAFAGLVAKKGAPMAVRVALLADEYSQLPDDLRGTTLLGLRDLADRYEESERTAFIYLDIRELVGDAEIVHGSAGTVTPLGVLEPLLNVFERLGAPLSVAVPFNELYRMGLIQGPPALAFLQERGFPALLIEPDPRPVITDREPLSAERFADGLYDYAVSLSSIPEAADRRYFLFSVGRRIVPLPEGLSVALFALTTALGLAVMLSYSLVHRHLLIARGRVFLRRAWVLPFFLGILFICILISGATISLLLRMAGANYGEYIYGAAALKFLFAIAIYFMASPLFSLRPVPKRAHFYASAAGLLFAAGCFFAALIDFTFVPIFLWAFACALVASLVHSPSAAFALAILAPLQILAAAAGAIGSGEDGTARLLLSSDFGVNLFLSFTTLPFLLLFRRATALSRSGGGASQLRRARYSRTLFFAGTLLALLSYALNTAKAERAAPPPVRERIDAVSVASSPLSMEVESMIFLDRRTLRVTLRPDGYPVRLDLSFESEDSVSVYDASVPYTISEDGKRASMTLGERPITPLTVDLTLPITAKGTLHAAALYTSPLKAGKETENRDYALIVDASKTVGDEK